MASQLPSGAHQPSASFKFPTRTFGERQRAFQHVWFRSWPWIHYNESMDAAFCFYCARADQEGKLRFAANKDHAFTMNGFTNWKKATESFRKHEESKCHKDAVQAMVILPATTQNVGDLLSSIHAKEKACNRKVFIKILQNLRFLGRQGLPLRGHDESESNFTQLLYLRGTDDPSIFDWLKKKSSKYTSPDIQNELLKIMSLYILRDIATNIHKSSFFTIMADECADVSNKEQLTLCFRWVDEQLEVHEEFTGLFQLPDTSANTIVAIIKDCLLRLNLQLSRCRGQCYDGASAMAGSHNGVATQLLEIEPKALFTHCHGHSLNLAVSDTVKSCKVLQGAFDTVYEIDKLIKYSPKRDAIFQTLKQQLAPDSPGFRVLCPTRWTVRGNSLQSILDNYAVLQELWDTVLEIRLDPEVRSRIIGVKAQMETFSFFFGVCLGERTMKQVDNLSKTLQSSTMSASEGQKVASLTVSTLEKMRTGENFELFWQLVQRKASSLDISEPSLPRQRKAPKRVEIGLGQPSFAASVEDYYRRQYYEVLDLIINSIKKRFDQQGFEKYKTLENLLIKAVSNSNFNDELTFVSDLYESDLNSSLLKTQLEIFTPHFATHSPICLMDVISYLKSFTVAERQLFSEIEKLVKIILVNPSTNAISERSFSAMRRIKTFLRSTMSQERLNSTMVLHVHKDKTDELPLLDIANEFVSSNEHRLEQLGKFSRNDL